MKMKCVCGAELELPDMSDAVLCGPNEAQERRAQIAVFDMRHKDCVPQVTPAAPEIIDYEVITGSWASQVVGAVKQMMTGGWKPWGNMLVATSYENRDHYGVTSQEYSQVMVKYK